MSLTGSLTKIVTATADAGAGIVQEGGAFTVGVLGTGRDLAEATRETVPTMWSDYLQQSRNDQKMRHAAIHRIENLRLESEMIAAAVELQDEVNRLGKNAAASKRLSAKLQRLLDDEEAQAA